jgi:hypothetical protein
MNNKLGFLRTLLTPRSPAGDSTVAGPTDPGRLTLSLALQGGGAHGAFTWGVLDRLLEEETIDIAAVSGTSAGAINAVALASGWRQSGREGARAALEQLWQAVGREAARSPMSQGGFSAFALGLATHLFSPYELNPLAINPLRELLNELVDFAALRAAPPMPILVAATQVRSGQCRIFREHELTADMVLASACLPQLHHAIDIDGEPYWDGGFVCNPTGGRAGAGWPQPDPARRADQPRRGRRSAAQRRRHPQPHERAGVRPAADQRAGAAGAHSRPGPRWPAWLAAAGAASAGAAGRADHRRRRYPHPS